MPSDQGYYTYDTNGAADGANANDAGAAAASAVAGASTSSAASPSPSAPAPSPAAPARVAVFDFDGTSMDGNSPVQLVKYLFKKDMLTKTDTLRIGLWALRYKFRLPQDEAWVRGMVFRAFDGKPVSEVDDFLYTFYDEEIAPRFRIAADAAMERHHMAGETVLVVSATFEPIVRRAMQFHPIDGQMCTRMKVKGGRYTRHVEGNPVEGAEKLNAIDAWCNATYGQGNWVLAYAYGDHHSDRPMLEAAETAFAVNPDRPLTRTAKDKNWTILEW